MKHDAVRKAFERSLKEPTKKKPNRAGRKKKDYQSPVHKEGVGINNKYLTYEQAKIFCAEAEYITTKKEYKDWAKIKGYKFLPLSPDYVYRKEWEGWTVYLSAGPPPVKQHFRLPYYEAKSIAQKLAIKHDLTEGDCRKNWIIFYDEQYLLPKEESEIPKGMPRLPEAYYDEWEGYPAFLGKGLKSRIETLQQKTQLEIETKNETIAKYNGQAVYAITTGIDPMNDNLIKVIVNYDGLSQLLATCDSLQYDIIATYIFDKNQLPAILDNLNANGVDKGDSCFLVRNMQALLSGLAFDTVELPKNLY